MEKYMLNEVYGIGRELPLNYVERRLIDRPFINNLNRGKYIVVMGHSKQGKTCLRKHCLNSDEYVLIPCSNKYDLADINSNILKKAGYAVIGSSESSMDKKVHLGNGHQSLYEEFEVNVGDANDVAMALKRIDFSKIIVMEDFHYLKQEIQEDFSIELKTFYETLNVRFVIVGSWLDKNKLVIYNDDLSGRIFSINTDSWTEIELRAVISKGARLLNVEFREEFVQELLERSSKRVYQIQEACFYLCEKYKILETQEKRKRIGKREDAIGISFSI